MSEIFKKESDTHTREIDLSLHLKRKHKAFIDDQITRLRESEITRSLVQKVVVRKKQNAVLMSL